MKCNVPEKRIYLLCDGLLPEDERTTLEAHCAACDRCARILAEAHTSLRILTQERPALLDEKRTDAILASALASAEPFSRIIKFPLPRTSIGALAAAAVLVIGLVCSLYLMRGVGRGRSLSAEIIAFSGESKNGVLVTRTKDTTVVFNAMCALQVRAHSYALLTKPSGRVVHFRLERGGLLVAARKGLYDTIAVSCGRVKVLATGTHFSVDRTDDEVRVAVIEGSVLVINGLSDCHTFVASGELCIAGDSSGTISTGPAPQALSAELSEKFETLGAWDLPRAMYGGCVAQQRHFGNGGHSPAASAQKSLAVIGRLIRSADYDEAIVSIVNYLTLYPADHDVAYCDLALCYSKTDRWESSVDAYAKALAATSDSLLAEAVLHRSNSILFSKLARFKDAERGIRRYLASFPLGAWREREYGMLVKIEIAQNRIIDAGRTVDDYAAEFPLAGSVEEMRTQIAKLFSDTNNKAAGVRR